LTPLSETQARNRLVNIASLESARLSGFLTAAAIDVRLIRGDDGFPLAATLTALAAVASPVISLIVARYVTSRTLESERKQRSLDRGQEWLKQLQDRQLTSSADFAHALFECLVAVERLHPLEGEPDAERLADSRRLLETARQEMSKVQLLFRQSSLPASKAAQAVVDYLDTSQRRLEERLVLVDPVARAEAQANYADAAAAARGAYERFLETAATALTRSPDPVAGAD
jgi:hypothetical protein